MASAMTFRLEQRVSIAGKGVGTIAFIGKTEFADGDWIGVILDEPKGKNNGTVPKKDGTTVRYFTCNDNHGLYVRPTQIESILNEPQTNLPRSTSVQSVKPPTTIPAGPAIPTGIPTTKPSALPAKPAAIRTPSGRSTGPARNSQSSHDLVSVVPKEEPKPVPVEPPPNIVEAVPAPLPPVAMKKVTSPTSADSTESQQMIANLKSKIADQEEQIQTLIKKRRDDVEKFKEFERTKLQLDQLQSYKREAQERIKELNDKLKHQENELKETREKFSAYRDEMNDTEIRLESLTLDLEMAEEKLEIVTAENTTLKEKLEEVQLELDVIKGEIQLNGTSQVASGIQKRIDDERTIKMEQALIKLRDLSLSKQAENETLKKLNETLEHRLKVIHKENDHLKTDMTTMQSTITDLKEQVDTCLGAQQMVDILTTKNLGLEDQVRELQETVENLESLYEMDKEMEENAREVEQDLRQTIDLLQNQIHDKERQIEQLQYSIGDHERTILKFRETLKNLQSQNEQNQKQSEKYLEQLKLAVSAQSSEFKAKILDTKSYGEHVDGELKKVEVANLSRHVQLLSLFLPEQWSKRGGDYDCLLLVLLIQRLISKCDLLLNEIEKKFDKVENVRLDDVIKSHRAEEWSFACKISQSISIFRLNLRKYFTTLEICSSEALRRVAHAFPDLITHEKALNFLIDLLQKEQLHDIVALTALDKTIVFFQHVFKSYLIEEKFNVATFFEDFVRVVLFSSDALRTDIQRLQILQKEFGQSGNDQSSFTKLIQRLIEANGQIKSQAIKINRLISDRSLTIDGPTFDSIESIILNLNRLTKTFGNICSSLSTQILMLTDAQDRISVEDIENIAYQVCDKVFKNEDRGPYETLWESMNESLTILNHIVRALETGVFDNDTNEENSRGKSAIYLIGEKLRMSFHELEIVRNRFELKEEELIEMKKIIKTKQDELAELNIRLSLNEKRTESFQREIDEKTLKKQQIFEEFRVESIKKVKQLEDTISVLQNDNEQLEQEKSLLKERLKQMNKINPIDLLLQKKVSTSPSTSHDGLVTLASNESEIVSLRNTIRLLKDELWHLKMSRTSNELNKLQLPNRDSQTSQIAEIYQNSNLILNDLFTSIANYKITGENVVAKREMIRSKIQLMEKTTSNLNDRLHECQTKVLPGSTISTAMKTFPNSKFSTREFVAEIQLPSAKRTGQTTELEINDEQFRTIMRQTIGFV